MELSQLHFHSWGLVAENPAVNQHNIMVIPTEYRLGHAESIVTNPQEDELEYESDEGVEVVKVLHNTAIECKWMKLNSNRVTPPNVRRNDDVIIMRLGNTDRYYWLDFNIANVKRLETAVWAWSADPDNPMADDLSNAYTLEISTHGKLITLTTTQANGEPFGYTHQYNTGDGRVTLEDTDGNSVYLDSAEREIGMINSDGTSFKLNKKDIEAYAPNNIAWTAVKSISFSCKQMTIVASDSLAIETNDMVVDSPTTTFTGVVNAASVNAAGSGSFGSVDAQEISATTLTADNATFKSHGPH